MENEFKTEQTEKTTVKKSSPDLLLYSDLYKNALLCEDVCARIIGKTEAAEDDAKAAETIDLCEGLRQELTNLLNGFGVFAGNAKEALAERNTTAEKLTLLERMPAEVGITVGTMFDHSAPKIAELVINSITVSIIDMKKAQRICAETGCSPAAYRLSADMIRFSEQHIELLKEFL